MNSKYEVKRPSKEILNKIRDIEITSLSDSANSNISMTHLIKPHINKNKIVGPALTLKLEKGDSLMVQKILEMAKPGDVVVIDTSGSEENAVWGDLRSLTAKQKELEAVIIDGAIRDIEGCREINFPIFCKYVVCASSTKSKAAEINVPIKCGGITVNPGDIIVGDLNGVISIPQENVIEIIERALEKELSVSKAKEEILNGIYISESTLNKINALES